MINLMPDEYKESIAYAKKNSQLIKWVFILMFASIGALLLIGGGILYTEQRYRSQIKDTEAKTIALKGQNIDQVNKELTGMSDNIKLMLQVMSKEILFSKLIRQIGAITPANTELEGLSIEKIDGGMTISASASDIRSATQLQLNLADPKNQVFEKADIDSISCSDAPTAEKKLPCSVTIKALFLKNNNPYLFIDPKLAEKPKATETKQ